MSRIGIKPVEILDNVNVEISPIEFKATGPMGELTVAIPHGITVVQKDKSIIVGRIGEIKLYKSLHGTVRSLISNAVNGVAKGFDKKLEMVGIGYRGVVENNQIVLQLGYTHPVILDIPEGIAAKIEKNVITIAGRDKHRVGQFSAEIRATRKPEPYKGKGIRYQGEKIRMKQGKATKASG